MAHRRISSGSSFERQIGYCRAVVAGDLIYVAGTTGYDYAKMQMPEGVVEQCRQAIANIERALAETGASLADLVRVTYYLPDRADFPACWPVLSAAFGANPPAATMVQAGLMLPEMKIEIEVTAVKAKAPS